MKIQDFIKAVNIKCDSNWVIVVNDRLEKGFSTLYITTYELWKDGKRNQTFQEATITPDPFVKDRLNTEVFLFLLDYVKCS